MVFQGILWNAAYGGEVRMTIHSLQYPFAAHACKIQRSSLSSERLGLDTCSDKQARSRLPAGASLFAEAFIVAHGLRNRKVHLVDSFMGLPPNTTNLDQGHWAAMTYTAVPLAEVKGAFERYGLLINNVHWHQGFFRCKS